MLAGVAVEAVVDAEVVAVDCAHDAALYSFVAASWVHLRLSLVEPFVPVPALYDLVWFFLSSLLDPSALGMLNLDVDTTQPVFALLALAFLVSALTLMWMADHLVLEIVSLSPPSPARFPVN